MRLEADNEWPSKLAAWLDAPNPSTNYAAACKLRQQGTGSWLLQDKRYLHWRSSSGSFLWLHGIPGCGKTVLSATILDQQAKTPPNAVLAYFYFDFNDDNKRKVSACIRSLVMQLAAQVPEGLQTVKSLYLNSENGQMQPREAAILPALDHMIQRTEHAYIILDTLDESDGHEELLDLIEGLAEKHKNRLHILATSRRERVLEERLKPIITAEIDITSAPVDEDIALFVDGRLQTDSRLSKWPIPIRNEIKDVISQKAHGMYGHPILSHSIVLTHSLQVPMGVLPA